MFVIVGGYIVYHASQETMVEDVEGHNIIVELEILNENTMSINTLQYHELKKSII